MDREPTDMIWFSFSLYSLPTENSDIGCTGEIHTHPSERSATDSSSIGNSANDSPYSGFSQVLSTHRD